MTLFIKHNLLLAMFYISCFESSSVKNYGQFEIQLTDAKSCKGPKRKDCANTTIRLTGNSSITCDILVREDIASIKAKVVGHLDNEELIKMQTSKICDHIFFTPLFKTIFKITDKCVLPKGDYTFSVNIAEIMNKYHGAAFMFGNWSYKATFYNDDCNFTCGIFQIAILPKKSTR